MVVVGGAVVVVVVAAADGAENATTRFVAGAKRRSSPTDGVGKWLAGTPMEARSWGTPVDGSSP